MARVPMSKRNYLDGATRNDRQRYVGFGPIRYRQVPFWAWGLTWNFFQHLYLWKFKLRMRTMVDLEKIIWRTSKTFVFGNGYNIVLAIRPADIGRPADDTTRS